ncbi:hypothetical protein [Nitratifractor sp.]
MKDLAITVNGIRFRVKNLDDDFASYVEKTLEESGIHFNRDNPAEKLFNAFLQLAARSYDYEKEIEEIISEGE